MNNDKKKEILEMLANKEISKEEAEKQLSELENPFQEATQIHREYNSESHSRTIVLFAKFIGVSGALVLVGVIYLTFFFPVTIKLWQEEGAQITVFQEMLVNMSNFCTSFGIFIIFVLIMEIIGCGIFILLLGRGGINRETIMNIEEKKYEKM